MSNDLGLLPENMAHLPGAPFTQVQIDAALGALRLATGWHIAPTRTDVIELDVRPNWQHLQLPTLELVAVVAVRDADTSEVVPATEYRVSHKLCTIKRTCQVWEQGYETVEVEFTHGYAELPPELLAVLADAINLASRDQNVRDVSIDDFSQSFGTSSMTGSPLGNAAILNHYSLSGGRSLYGFGIA